MPRTLRARWILPIDRPPIDGGWIEIARDGRIAAFGGGTPPSTADDLGDVAILPGLVNAHTHLELSWMAGLVPPAVSMAAWIRTLRSVRRAGAPGGADSEMRAARDAAAAMRATGTVLVGDISNGLTTPGVIAEAGLGGVVFHELIGFNHPDPVGAVRAAAAKTSEMTPPVTKSAETTPEVVFSVVAHAPYSVSPALFREIAGARQRAPLSVHLAESAEEIEFLRTGRGPIRDMLETLGVWTDDWKAPQCDPVEYLDRLGYLQRGTLVVHAVHLADEALDRLRKAGAVVVTCPRSNLWVGSGPPRLSHFYSAKLPVAVGTDSLASTPTLNLFDELREMRRLAPEIAAATLLESATRVGAEALGFGDTYGTLAPGKRAALVAVRLPARVTDVEEHLVTSVRAADIGPVG